MWLLLALAAVGLCSLVGGTVVLVALAYVSSRTPPLDLRFPSVDLDWDGWLPDDESSSPRSSSGSWL